MAIEHSVIPDSDLHEPKGVVDATSGQVYVADGAGSGTWEEQASLPTNEVYVASETDLPTAVAGVITLAPSTLYHILGSVDLGSDRIVFSSNSILQGQQRALSTITSTTTSPLFKGTSVDVRIYELTIVATTASKIVEFDGGGTSLLTLKGVNCYTVTADAVTVNNYSNLLIDNCVFFGGVDVLTITGASNAGALIQLCGFVGYTGRGIDLGTSVGNGGIISACSVVGTGGADTSIVGAAANANLHPNKRWVVDQCDFVGANTVLTGVDVADDQWLFRDNTGLTASRSIGDGFITGNANSTTVAVTQTDYEVNFGTGFNANREDRFTVSNDGRITYNGNVPRTFTVQASVSGTTDSGTATIFLKFAKNGVVDNSTQVSREYASTAVGNVGLFGSIEMSSGDYIELYLYNDTGTQDYTVSDCHILITE